MSHESRNVFVERKNACGKHGGHEKLLERTNIRKSSKVFKGLLIYLQNYTHIHANKVVGMRITPQCGVIGDPDPTWPTFRTTRHPTERGPPHPPLGQVWTNVVFLIKITVLFPSKNSVPLLGKSDVLSPNKENTVSCF